MEVTCGLLVGAFIIARISGGGVCPHPGQRQVGGGRPGGGYHHRSHFGWWWWPLPRAFTRWGLASSLAFRVMVSCPYREHRTKQASEHVSPTSGLAWYCHCEVTMRGRPLTKWLLPWFSTQVGHSEPHRSLVIAATPAATAATTAAAAPAAGSSSTSCNNSSTSCNSSTPAATSSNTSCNSCYDSSSSTSCETAAAAATSAAAAGRSRPVNM